MKNKKTLLLKKLGRMVLLGGLILPVTLATLTPSMNVKADAYKTGLKIEGGGMDPEQRAELKNYLAEHKFNLTINPNSALSADTQLAMAVISIKNAEKMRPVVVNQTAKVNASFSLKFDNVPKLKPLNTATKDLLNKVTEVNELLKSSLGSLNGVELDTSNLNKQIELLGTIQNFKNISFDAPASVNDSGNEIDVDLKDSMDKAINESTIRILDNLKAAVDGLEAKGKTLPGKVTANTINASLKPFKLAFDAIYNNVGKSINTNFLSEGLTLDQITVSVPANIEFPDGFEGDLDEAFVGSFLESDGSIFGLPSENEYIYFEGE